MAVMSPERMCKCNLTFILLQALFLVSTKGRQISNEEPGISDKEPGISEKELAPDEDEGETCNSEACQDAAEKIKSAMDESIDPCEDFYSFTCGSFVEQNKDK